MIIIWSLPINNMHDCLYQKKEKNMHDCQLNRLATKSLESRCLYVISKVKTLNHNNLGVALHLSNTSSKFCRFLGPWFDGYFYSQPYNAKEKKNREKKGKGNIFSSSSWISINSDHMLGMLKCFRMKVVIL